MNAKSLPLEFLHKAKTDAEIRQRVMAAWERGTNLAADEVLAIAREAGYSFDRKEFEQAVLSDMEKRYAAGDKKLAAVFGNHELKAPPESSCAKGCLSYSINYCPSPPYPAE